MFVCAFQLTGVLIGAAVAIFLIGVVVLFVYRRYKVSRECDDRHVVKGNVCCFVISSCGCVDLCRSAAAQRSPLSLQETGQSSVLWQENHEKGLHLLFLFYLSSSSTFSCHFHLLLLLRCLRKILPSNITFFCLNVQTLSFILPPSPSILLSTCSQILFINFHLFCVSRSRRSPPSLRLPPAPPQPLLPRSNLSVSAKEPKFSPLLAGTSQ